MHHGQRQQAVLAVVVEELMQPLVAQARLVRATQVAQEVAQQVSHRVVVAVLAVRVRRQGQMLVVTVVQAFRQASQVHLLLVAVVVLVQPQALREPQRQVAATVRIMVRRAARRTRAAAVAVAAIPQAAVQVVLVATAAKVSSSFANCSAKSIQPP